MFADILDDADRRHEEDRLDVVPVLMDDLDSYVPLVREICRHRYGFYPSLAEKAVEGCADEPPDNLKAFVQGITTGGSEKLTVVRTPAGLWAARFVGEPEPSNPGSVNFLGLLSAVLDGELTRRRVGVLAYDETQMDAIFLECIWRTMLDDLPASGTLDLSTLVILAGNTRVDFGRHCRAAPGIRFAIQDGVISVRRRWDNVQGEITRLAAGAHPIVLFLGAGSSRSSDLPLGDEMRDEALRRYTAAESTTPIGEVILLFHRMLSADDRLLEGEKIMGTATFASTLTLERVLREEARRGGLEVVPETLVAFGRRNALAVGSPGPAIVALRALTALQSRLIIVTVNFDTLIEHSPTGAVRTFITESEFEQFPAYLTSYLGGGGNIPLLKLHGSIEDPRTIVADVDLTAQGLPEPHASAVRALAHEHLGTQWVYVGYSMRDPDVGTMLQQPQFPRYVDEHWVTPLTDPHVRTFVEAHRIPVWRKWAKRDTLLERSLTETADTFFVKLAEALGVAVP